jgi:ParB family chromosome partitioning protein
MTIPRSSRKISELIGEGFDPEAPSPARRPRALAFERELAIDESQTVTDRLVLAIDPAKCSIWADNARDYARLDSDNCADLIGSITPGGTNSVAALVRRTADADRPYELIVGTRRHYAVSWLRANGFVDTKLLVEVLKASDEEAYRVADIENRERQDVTVLERARNYRMALDKYYGGTQARMAERLGIPKQSLSRLLAAADLPDVVVNAFAAPADVKLVHAERLCPLLANDRQRQALIVKADEIMSEQSRRRQDGRTLLPAPSVVSALIAATKLQTKSSRLREISASSGARVATVISLRQGRSVTIKIEPDPSLSIEEILESLRPAVMASRPRKID